jgi:hypothetical protein
MPWRTSDGAYVLEGPPAHFPMHLERLQLPGGEVLSAAPSFYLVTAEGHVTGVFGGEPQASSLDDTLYITPIYAVTDGRLVQYMWIDKWDRDAPEVKECEWSSGPSHLSELPASSLPFDSVAVLAADVPIQLTYGFGNERNPVDPVGRFELEVKPDGTLRLEHHARFAKIQVWTGRATPEALDRLWAAIKHAGFPQVPKHALPPDATIRRLSVETASAKQTAYVEWHAVTDLPGYREAFAILDAMIAELRPLTTTAKPDKQPPVVSRIERLA